MCRSTSTTRDHEIDLLIGILFVEYAILIDNIQNIMYINKRNSNKYNQKFL